MRRVSLGLPLLAVMSLAGPSPTFADVVLPDHLQVTAREQGNASMVASTHPPAPIPRWISVSPPLVGHRRAIC